MSFTLPETHFLRVVLLSCLLLFCSLTLLATVDGTVTAGTLNVRVKPGTNFSVVTSLQKGDKVNIIRKEGQWYEISAPTSSTVFIVARFLDEGVTVSDVNLRAGPSVAYKSYGTAKKGEHLIVISTARTHWTQVAPPKWLTAWVSSKFISISPDNMPKLKKDATVAVAEDETETSEPDKILPDKIDDTHTVVATIEKKAQTTSPKNVKNSSVGDSEENKATDSEALPFVSGDAKEVTIEGVLLPLSASSVYVTHALAVKVRDEYFPICYIHTDKLNLKPWIKRRVKITGQQRWVKGWKRPLVELDRIAPQTQRPGTE